MNNTQEYHYVYKITNHKPTDSRKFYIGVRTCKNCLPEEDIKYWGSSNVLSEAIKEIGQNHFSKKILSIWESREEANLEEIRLHEKHNVSSNTEYYNKANATSIGFCTKNQVTVIDTRTGLTKNVTKKEFEKYDYYISTTYGKVTVIDIRTGISKHVTKKEFEKYDYYISCTKGQVTVIDTRNGLTKNVTKEEFDKYDYYISCRKGTITALDINTNKHKTISMFEFINSPNFVGLNKGKTTVFDTKNKTTTHIDKKLLDNKRYISLLKNKVIVKELSSGKNIILNKTEYIKNKNDYQILSSNRTTVIDKKTNQQKCISIDEYNKNKNFESIMKNKVTVIDIRDNNVKHVSTEDFKKFDYYVSINAKKIAVYKQNGTLFKISYGNFSKFCKLHNLSITALTYSYKNNSKPIFENPTSMSLLKLKQQNRDFQIGWFAKELPKR